MSMRSQTERDATAATGAAAKDAPGAAPTRRSVEKLYVHPETLACALQRRCRPCAYKIVLHPRPGLLPNTRPELCPRMAATDDGDDGADDKLQARGIGLYEDPRVRRVLTVGDGNFSFSRALARAFGSSAGRTLVATSHETRASVVETYPDGASILEELGAMDHVTVRHGVDATDPTALAELAALPGASTGSSSGGFDRVLWNFPCVRVARGKDGQNEEMELNKRLLRDFFTHAASILSPTGEIHVTHKTKAPFCHWGIEALAAAAGLAHVRSVVFDRCLYPGYSNKKVLSKGSFPIWDSQTFVFVPTDRHGADYESATAAVGLMPMTEEILDKVYLRLTPTMDEKLAQEAKLDALRRKQEQKKSEKAHALKAKKKTPHSRGPASTIAPKGKAEASVVVGKKRKHVAMGMTPRPSNKHSKKHKRRG